ncbi:hypothetical protein [Nicoliella lavandulae]|uniref:Uncharacterized protein n=1 Tax=Nicoliella lavandulae TaxID=3082954 RepID=A0ABU8SKM9_9LACO
MKKKDYIRLTIFIIIAVLLTFIVTLNLKLSEMQLFITWLVIFFILQIILTTVIIVKTKRRLKQEQIKAKAKERIDDDL